MFVDCAKHHLFTKASKKHHILEGTLMTSIQELALKQYKALDEEDKLGTPATSADISEAHG